jgi:hypothetical protein
MSTKKTLSKKKTTNINPAIFVIGLGMVMLAVALSVILTQGNNSPTVVQATSVPSQVESIPYPDVPRVSLIDAKAAYDQGSAVFLDVRGMSDYQAEHITGAISIPETQIESRLNELNPQDWIITYCT